MLERGAFVVKEIAEKRQSVGNVRQCRQSGAIAIWLSGVCMGMGVSRIVVCVWIAYQTRCMVWRTNL